MYVKDMKAKNLSLTAWLAEICGLSRAFLTGIFLRCLSISVSDCSVSAGWHGVAVEGRDTLSDCESWEVSFSFSRHIRQTRYQHMNEICDLRQLDPSLSRVERAPWKRWFTIAEIGRMDVEMGLEVYGIGLWEMWKERKSRAVGVSE